MSVDSTRKCNFLVFIFRYLNQHKAVNYLFYKIVINDSFLYICKKLTRETSVSFTGYKINN